MSRSRFTVRWVLLTVAVFAVALASFMSVMRAGRIARSHQTKAAQCFLLARDYRDRSLDQHNHNEKVASNTKVQRKYARTEYQLRFVDQRERSIVAARALVRSYDARSDYFRGLGLKYSEAAQTPWLPVAGDPPEPECKLPIPE